MILEHLGSINEPLLISIIRTLLQDQALESNHLHHAIPAVFISIIRQFHRKDKIDPAKFPEADIMEFIAIDLEYIPFMTEIKTYLSDIPPHRMVSGLCAALEKAMKRLYGVDSIANIMEPTANFQDPSFVPGLVDVFLYDSENDDGRLLKKTTTALSCFGDAVIDCLDSKIREMSEPRLLEMLTIIRKIGTERAEECLIRHFNRFIRSFRSDTLSTCRSLVSRKALMPPWIC